MTLTELRRRLPDMDFQRRHILTAGAWVLAVLLILGIFNEAGLAVLVGTVCVYGYARLLRVAIRADLAERDGHRLNAMVEADMQTELRELLGE